MDTLNNLPTPTGSNWDLFYIVAAVLVAAYEIVVRFIPTVADRTIIGFIYRVLDWIVENRAKGDAKDPEDDNSSKRKVFKIFKRNK